MCRGFLAGRLGVGVEEDGSDLRFCALEVDIAREGDGWPLTELTMNRHDGGRQSSRSSRGRGPVSPSAECGGGGCLFTSVELLFDICKYVRLSLK